MPSKSRGAAAPARYLREIRESQVLMRGRSTEDKIVKYRGFRELAIGLGFTVLNTGCCTVEYLLPTASMNAVVARPMSPEVVGAAVSATPGVSRVTCVPSNQGYTLLGRKIPNPDTLEFHFAPLPKSWGDVQVYQEVSSADLQTTLIKVRTAYGEYDFKPTDEQTRTTAALLEPILANILSMDARAKFGVTFDKSP